MEEVAHLIIRVSADQATAAKTRLKELGFAAKEAETATGGLMAAWKSLSGMLVGAVGIGTAVAGLRKLLDVAKQFESLEAQLKTATGSAEEAKVAFEALQDFATQTPYDLAQTVDAFIKLTNLGLTPSEEALRSYGNTASAMGKSLEDMVLAVANATVGQFMNLRQFGIKASTEADGIAFTFQGVTTKVKNSAKDIEDYFVSLGQDKFGTAMADRMATLEGKLSNLGDAWDLLFATIAKAGAGDAMKQAIEVAISGLEELTSMIASGQLAEQIDAIASKFDGLATDVAGAFDFITAIIHNAFGDWKDEGNSVVNELRKAFMRFPENVRAMIHGVGATFGLLQEYSDAAGKGIYDTIFAYFQLLVRTAENVGKEIFSHLNPRAKDFDFIGAQAAAMEEFGKRTVKAWDSTVESIANATDAYGQVITGVLDERDASLASFDAKISKADALRAAYDAMRTAREKSEGGDRLAKFAIGGKGATEEFRNLEKALRTQEEALVDSYEKRKQLIVDNTAAEDALRSELLAQLEVRYGEERKAIVDKLGLDSEVRATAMLDAAAYELAILDDQYAQTQKKLEDALNAKLITEEDYARRSKQIDERHSRDAKQISIDSFVAIRTQQLSTYSGVLSMAADITERMGDLAGQNAGFAKAAFIASKAIAIGQAIVNTEVAATRALAEGGLFGGAAGATLMRVIGYGSVALIAAQSAVEYAGKFEYGGMIPAGKTGITQEAGFELVRGPAVVSSARATADQLAGQGGGSKTTVNVINQTGAEVETREREDSNGKVVDIIIKKIKSELTSSVKSGGDPFAKALESTYKLNRGAA